MTTLNIGSVRKKWGEWTCWVGIWDRSVQTAKEVGKVRQHAVIHQLFSKYLGWAMHWAS